MNDLGADRPALLHELGRAQARAQPRRGGVMAEFTLVVGNKN
jgi:hypothetical protein